MPTCSLKQEKKKKKKHYYLTKQAHSISYTFAQ